MERESVRIFLLVAKKNSCSTMITLYVVVITHAPNTYLCESLAEESVKYKYLNFNK